MKPEDKYKKISIALAVILHILVFALLFSGLEYNHTPNKLNYRKPVKIVNAVALDKNQVQEEINKIHAREQAKQKAETVRRQRLERLEAAVKQQRIKEEKHLAEIKTQKEKLAREQLAKQKEAKAQLAEIKKQQEIEKSRLATLKKQTGQSKTQNLTKEAQKKFVEQQFVAEEQKLKAVKTYQIQKEIDKYSAAIKNTIEQHWIIPKNINKEMQGILSIKLAPGGVILAVRTLKSSGDVILDRSVITAIWKSSPLPVPQDSSLFNEFREVQITFSPKGILNQ